MNKKFDLVLWGASGFTGQLVAEYLAEREETAVRWAIAGRNLEKLEMVRQKLTTINPNCAELPILIADSQDKASLEAMVSQTRVVCSTVGPYALYGTLLVSLCAAYGVDYCDLTGEVPWIRQMIDAYHDQAVQTKARIIHCCGFDSIPSDLGVLMMQEHAMEEYGRTCPEIKHAFVAVKGGISGGTIASLIAIVEQAAEDSDLRKLLQNPYSLVPIPQPEEVPADQTWGVYDKDFGFWTVPFVMAAINTRIVYRSHALLGYPWGPSFRYHETQRHTSGASGRLTAQVYSAGLQVFTGLTAFGPTRKMLEKAVLPQPGEGPAKESRERGYFKSRLLGTVPSQDKEPEILVEGTVIGKKDPGYGETAKMLSEAALCLALDEIPGAGGVLTPSSAMGTQLTARLRRAGMTFAVESGPK